MNKMIDLDIRGYQGAATTLLGLFEHVATRENWSAKEIEAVIKEATKHDDYDHLVETIQAHCKY